MIIMVGSGRLTEALLTQIQHSKVGIYGRNHDTVTQLLRRFSFTAKVSREDISKATTLILCLPKDAYQSFFDEHATLLKGNVLLVHCATALMEDEVRQMSAGKCKVVPCKLVGHARQMCEDGEGLFAIPDGYDEAAKTIQQLFPQMQYVRMTEEKVLRANQIATEETLNMLMKIKNRADQHQVPEMAIKQIQKQIGRGVIRASFDNDLGGFAKKIQKELEEKKGEKDEA
ncbi:NAD(P)-binding domain-containing protein [Bacillus sp. FJAT-45037]|uniref:NAD(P)-binding domain-containing protein n=1 Tax=Bacillus sp. FJAT-45037 TaxID=2011007 RepID=UPI000C236A7F|nr:NAD(P)-binding domain-containing protein [Bacillus sp. FJAT-45037]